MPLIYGEGANAFIRLQMEILNKTDDESIFAWDTAETREGFMGPNDTGLLATSPSCFQRSGNVQSQIYDLFRPPFSMTNKGLQIDLTLFTCHPR